MKDHSKCPFCLGNGYSVHVHENEYILQILNSFMIDLKTDKSREQLLDRYACELTAYMNGRIEKLNPYDSLPVRRTVKG